MATRTLTDSQEETLKNALRVAAEQFDKDAAEFKKTAAYIRAGNDFPMFAKGEDGAVAAERLEAQFVRQAKEAREMLAMAEDSAEINFCT